MQLDRTRITIRPRSAWETLDLALRVTWTFWPTLLLSTAVLAIPCALVNGYVLSWMLSGEYSDDTISRYLWSMTLLVFCEAATATLATTTALGRLMFLQEVSARVIWADLRSCAVRIFWCHGVVRGGFVLCWALAMLQESLEFTPGEGLLLGLAFYQLVQRSARPFLNEIIVLERNPLRAATAKSITISRRSRSLHGPHTGDLVGRWMFVAVACVVLTANLSLTFWFVAGIVTGVWSWGPLMVQVLVPLAMWLVVTFAAVVRYLSYLDLRIRREGWEVELLVRAAARELQGAVT